MPEEEIDPIEEMIRIFAKWKDGRISKLEQQKLNTWLNSSPDKKQAWEEIDQVWQNAHLHSIPQGSLIESQWQKLKEQMKTNQYGINSALEGLNRGLPKNRGTQPQIIRWSFAWFGIIALASLIFIITQPKNEWNSSYIPLGEKQKLSLGDGSSVELNAGSELDYLKNFSTDLRQVKLKGEAYFQVVTSPAPFEIETEHALLRVMGTAFNVRTWDNDTKLFVQKGQVQIVSKSYSQNLIISSGQMAICKNGVPLVITEMEPKQILGWRNGELIFRNTPISNVLQELQRTYNISIQADSTLLIQKITASFSQEPFEDILTAISQAINANIHRKKDGFLLTAM